MDDREKVIKGLECCSAMCGAACRECPYTEECADVFDSGVAHLTADALKLLKGRPKIVQCQDCKHSERTDCGEYRCFMWDYFVVQADGFCNYGERKENCNG